ncbi:MAG: CPBP family intramembrane glutamic endopeptidase [Pseudomonadota bacterium]
MRAPSARTWPLAHTAFAFAALPAIGLAMRAVWPQQDDALILLRECLMFFSAYGLWCSLRRNESLGWSAIGLAKPALKPTALIVVIGLAVSAALIAVWDIVMDDLHIPLGGKSASVTMPTSLAVLLLMILRAGVLEEFFFRGVAMGRLEAATGSRAIAAVLPLFVFAGLHWNTGLRNMLGALALGLVLTVLYFWKRNLWANIIVHFVIDLAPVLQ